MATQAWDVAAEPTVPQLPGGRCANGIRGSGNRTNAPLLARVVPAEESLNWNFREKFPYSLAPYQSMPSPPCDSRDPSGCSLNDPDGAWIQPASDSGVPSKMPSYPTWPVRPIGDDAAARVRAPLSRPLRTPSRCSWLATASTCRTKLSWSAQVLS